MFEKESQDYAIREVAPRRELYIKGRADIDTDYEKIKKIWQDGAEFGYNKGYHDAEEHYMNVIDSQHKLVEESKANEWHYVKDELPPIKKEYCGRSELVLVLSKEKEVQYAQYVEKEKTWARGIWEVNFKPYAWKEIVLPELKESE